MSYWSAASAFRPDSAYGSPAVHAGPLSVRMLHHADLTAEDRARWAMLSAAAGATNVFAQDWFMEAALHHAQGGREALLAVVGVVDGPWLGVMPLIAEAHFGRWPARIWRSWRATNQFLGTPLVIGEGADLFWERLLAFLDARDGGEILLHFEGFAEDDPVSAALFARCAREKRALHTLHRLDRPAHRPGDDGERPGDAKARGRLRNLARRLERDHGAIAVDMLGVSEACDGWVNAFLTMEAAGWKGGNHSALSCDPATEALFREVIGRGHANGSARLASLSVGGRVIAMSSWFESGNWGHGFKMAFDEAYRSYAPGQLLMRAIADRIGSRGDLSFDTCTSRESAGSHHLWRSSRTFVDGALAIGSARRRLHFGTLMHARAAYAAVKTRLFGGAGAD